MIRDEYGFKLLIDKYERMFRDDMWKILKQRDFHMYQLKTVIKAANEMLEVIYEEIEGWCDSIKEVYEVDDAINPFQKFQVFIMKKYVIYRYEKALDESQSIEQSKEKLESFLKLIDPTYESK